MRHIICFGNPLHGDDGFGHAVYQRLASLSLPQNTRLFDAGTPGLNAMTLFNHCTEAVIVDAMASCGEPGRLHVLEPQELAEEACIPGHGVGVAYLLQAISALDAIRPQIRIIGVEALNITPFHPGLSGPVAKAVDETVAYLAPYFEIH